MVPLALWDENLDGGEKKHLAEKISNQPKDGDDRDEFEFVGRHSMKYGKPDLLAVNIDAKSLSELVTPASWRFFHILKISPNFLSLSQQ